MPFDNLKKKLGYTDDDAYVQAPVSIPGTDGLDPSASPQSFLGQMLGKTIGTGDDTPTTDSIQPESSPIDYLAGGLASKLGEALVGDAGSVLSNEIGAINPDDNIKSILAKNREINNTLKQPGYVPQNKSLFDNIVDNKSGGTGTGDYSYLKGEKVIDPSGYPMTVGGIDSDMIRVIQPTGVGYNIPLKRFFDQYTPVENSLGKVVVKDLPKELPPGTVTHIPNDQMHLGEIKVLPSEVTQKLGSVRYGGDDVRFKKLLDKLKGNK